MFNFDFISGINNVINNHYYEKLRENLNNVLYYLNKSIESLNAVDDVLINVYSIDENTVNEVSVKTLKEDLKNKVSYLNNNIIPSINSKINS